MSIVEESIDVEVPVRTAYNQWTQFESFPQFMEGVERVEQRGPDMTHWVTRIGGITREFDAEIVEQRPDEKVSWRSVQGPQQMGVVAFQSIDPGHTRVMLRMDFEPEGIVEKAGDALGIVKHRVHDDLEHFKEFIESRGGETGAWRGEIHRGQTQEPSGAGDTGMGTTGMGTTGTTAGAGAAGAGAAGLGAAYGDQGERLGDRAEPVGGSAPQMGQEQQMDGQDAIIREQQLDQEQMLPGQEPQLGAETGSGRDYARDYGASQEPMQYPGEMQGELGSEAERGQMRDRMGDPASSGTGTASPDLIQEQQGDVYIGEERTSAAPRDSRLEDEELLTAEEQRDRDLRPGESRLRDM